LSKSEVKEIGIYQFVIEVTLPRKIKTDGPAAAADDLKKTAVI